MESQKLWRKLEKEFKVTRERIRQIEAKAIRKLKHPTEQEIKRFSGIKATFSSRPSEMNEWRDLKIFKTFIKVFLVS